MEAEVTTGSNPEAPENGENVRLNKGTEAHD